MNDWFEKIKVEVTPYFILIALITWTLLVYTIGSLYYSCECELYNLRGQLGLENYTKCYEFFQATTSTTVPFVKFDEEGGIIYDEPD